MQLTWKSAAVIIVAFGGIAAGVYTLGVQQGARSGQEAGAGAEPVPAAAPAVPERQASAGPISPGAQMPPNHPPLDSIQQPPVQSDREGKAQADPNANVTHFRVGERNVKNIFIDGKVVWVGTSSGLIRYDTGDDSFRLFDTRDGLRSAAVLRVTKLEGRIAAGTADGLALYDGGNKWEMVDIPGAGQKVYVDDILTASNGDVWIATHSGAYRAKAGDLKDRGKWESFTAHSTKGGLPDDRVDGLAQGKDGAIWFATEDGVARFKGGWQNWNHGRGLGAPADKVKSDRFMAAGGDVPAHHAAAGGAKDKGLNIAYNPNYVTSILVDRDGTVWCGTWGGGLARFDGKGWRNYTVADGLPGNHVFTLRQDEAGRLWIGTNNGLARREGKGFAVLTTANGLFSNFVFSMAVAPDGSLWVGTFGGVARLKGTL